MKLVVDLRDNISEFTRTTQAMSNMDYDLVEIVVDVANILTQQKSVAEIYYYIFSYKRFGTDDQVKNNDSEILTSAIKTLANAIQHQLDILVTYDADGNGLFKYDDYVNERLYLKSINPSNPFVKVNPPYEI